MRAAANTAADVIVVIQPGTEGIIYDMNPPQLANGYTWLFVEVGSPVQYAGYVVEILGDKRSFEALPIVVEPPSDALYSVFLTADELQQSVSLHTQISQAHQQLAQIFSAALQRTQKK
ncbi:MAG: hypothetical protein IPK17_38410 [Chloroflexi bacterium]|uniref:hypothetical protein n=1 Tax=Candidatus Flexifilum breve TaxID=3140694 RepID=UPI0031354EAD|nr:hypothetical protein [Chloroflexota bacterium]